MKEIKVGSVVMVKTGSPAMTVVEINEDWNGETPISVATCVIGNDEGMRKEDFPLDALVRAIHHPVIGKRVRLKSGGPIMEVIDGPTPFLQVRCAWKENPDDHREHWFDWDDLEEMPKEG